MPRETSPNVQRAREHLARADRLLAAVAPAPAAPVTPAPTQPTSSLRLMERQ